MATRLPACTAGWISGRISSRVREHSEPLMDIARYVKWLKPPVFLLCLWPAASLAWGVYHDAHYPDNPLLSANPFAFIRNTTGTWTLIFICITLGLTPARRLFHQNWLI